MSLLRTSAFAIFVDGDFEIPCFHSFARAAIEDTAIIFPKSWPKSKTDYTTISLINKGTDGQGTDVLFSITTNSNDPDGQDIIAFVPIHMIENFPIEKGYVLSLKKEDSGMTVTLLLSVLIVNDRRY